MTFKHFVFLFRNIWFWMKLPSTERLRVLNNEYDNELMDSGFTFPQQMVREIEKENCSQYSSCNLVSTEYKQKILRNVAS